ncbi:MAG: hypothetical protein ACOY0T_03630 [Myxococcota bacterium]
MLAQRPAQSLTLIQLFPSFTTVDDASPDPDTPLDSRDDAFGAARELTSPAVETRFMLLFGFSAASPDLGVEVAPTSLGRAALFAIAPAALLVTGFAALVATTGSAASMRTVSGERAPSGEERVATPDSLFEVGLPLFEVGLTLFEAGLTLFEAGLTPSAAATMGPISLIGCDCGCGLAA